MPDLQAHLIALDLTNFTLGSLQVWQPRSQLSLHVLKLCQQMMLQCELPSIPSPIHLHDFTVVSDALFDGGEVTWSRIVAFYCIVIRCASDKSVSKSQHLLNAYIFGCCLDYSIHDWIEIRGGWSKVLHSYVNIPPTKTEAAISVLYWFSILTAPIIYYLTHR
jgi:hypothetical protein